MSALPLELLQQEIDYVIANDEFAGAFECYNLTKDWLANKSGITKNSPEYAQYDSYLAKLKFLSFNFLSDNNERADLLRNYFNFSFEMKHFDLWQKLETELVSIRDLNDRDAFKAAMREALEKCENVLISRQRYVEQEMPRKVSEWIKNFVSNLGLDKIDKVKKMEYLTNSRFIKMLDIEDRDRVKTLLDIYEKLRLSSRDPEGYENSVVMNMDGKEIVFNRGEVEEIFGIDKIKKITTNVQPAAASFIPANVPIEPIPSAPSPAPSPLAELQQILKNYSPSSLEYKVINQEIARLQAAELKKNKK